MNQTLIDELIKYAFAVATLATTTLLPVLITAAIGAIRDQRMREYAVTLVRYAQQTIPDKSVRYNYAVTALKNRFPRLDERQLVELIEASVHAVKSVPVAATQPER